MLENIALMANHASTRTTQLYDTPLPYPTKMLIHRAWCAETPAGPERNDQFCSTS